MKRFVIVISTLVALSAPAAAADCIGDYKAFWDKFNNGAGKALPGDHHAIVARQALRAFDACQAGDEPGSKSIFDRIRDAAPAKGDAYFKDLQQSAPAKK